MSPHLYARYTKRLFIKDILLSKRAIVIPLGATTPTTAFKFAVTSRRSYHNSTTDYTEGTHHLNNNQLDDLLGHLESTKVSDPRTVKYFVTKAP